MDVRIHNPDSEGFGDICLRGRSMMMGYLNDEEKTKETLDEDGWLHTGDLGKIDEEGNVWLSIDFYFTSKTIGTSITHIYVIGWFLI